jgi:hypothetical protein
MGMDNVSPSRERKTKAMSGKVEDLAKKAYEDSIKHNPSFLVNSEMVRKKFAEMLIFETMDVCHRAVETDIPMADAVRKHFNL